MLLNAIKSLGNPIKIVSFKCLYFVAEFDLWLIIFNVSLDGITFCRHQLCALTASYTLETHTKIEWKISLLLNESCLQRLTSNLWMNNGVKCSATFIGAWAMSAHGKRQVSTPVPLRRWLTFTIRNRALHKYTKENMIEPMLVRSGNDTCGVRVCSHYYVKHLLGREFSAKSWYHNLIMMVGLVIKLKIVCGGTWR